MIADANLPLYARDEASPFHDRARPWLEAALNGPVRVGLPWQSLIAFMRVSTRANAPNPLTPVDAAAQVDGWLAAPAAWVPTETRDHARVLGELVRRHQVDGRLIHDAHLAAPAICHGVEICSADADFARFTEVRWANPVAEPEY
ncbi:MAG: type II toxin-antitoxin system VapC family toxin [Actinobacteria bacterium]|nr:type II toxin-antitoxin system VapC family toxin [Actinomycetota bacterium]